MPMGGYYIPPSLRSRPGINQILKYYQYHRETENEYKSYLEKEVAFKSKYQAEFSKFIREYKPEKPLNQSHVRTDLYRALHERQSSSNYVEAVYEFYFLFRLSEEYDLLEMQNKNQKQAIHIPGKHPAVSARYQSIPDVQDIEETLSENYTFQRKGNENQYKHEVKVLTKLTEAKAQLDGPDLSVESIHQARDKIVEGMTILRDRQKLIKLTDSSELGWRVGKEYTTNPIADDSEDEKKMIRAQNRAERRSKSDEIKKKSTKTVRKLPYSTKERSNPYLDNRDMF
ncbi:Hypothetical predicted protein [Mytilus galloprovincialis]|uniref:Uncharacterized protein n=1 Tax=Mytilus galloprovincialis TaxID=29158 RepID=A0A8B6FPP9_MYTGA|nr:Hypothetical predicted protein [Mytilus galloprovincialis]